MFNIFTVNTSYLLKRIQSPPFCGLDFVIRVLLYRGFVFYTAGNEVGEWTFVLNLSSQNVFDFILDEVRHILYTYKYAHKYKADVSVFLFLFEYILYFNQYKDNY